MPAAFHEVSQRVFESVSRHTTGEVTREDRPADQARPLRWGRHESGSHSFRLRHTAEIVFRQAQPDAVGLLPILGSSKRKYAFQQGSTFRG